MPDWIVKLFFGFIPQKDDDAMKQYFWRWKSAALTLIAIVVASYAASWLPQPLRPAYADTASIQSVQDDFQKKLDVTNDKLDATNVQVTALATQLKNGQVRSLNADLIDARRYQCRSINSNDKTALPFWNNRIQELKLAYQQLTNENWPSLDCKSF